MVKDFVIAVRSYDRSKLFIDRTYKMLAAQADIRLEERLYIFVADQVEFDKYKGELGDKPYKEMVIVGQKGGDKAMWAITNYFEAGQHILFLDDDHLGFFEFSSIGASAKPNLNANNLVKYVTDAFNTLETFALSGFIFRNIQNSFWLKKSPFKEIKPFFFYGGCFGLVNDRELIRSTYAQCDDCERTAKILEKDKAVLVYNWAGIIFEKGKDYGANAGGMQSSGDRDEGVSDRVKDLYENSPVVKKYFETPLFNSTVKSYDLKMKKQSYKRNRPIWHSYFEADKETIF